METYKIIKHGFSWNILTVDKPAVNSYQVWGTVCLNDYPESVKILIQVIKKSILPYIKRWDYYTVWGVAYTGGPYLKIELNPLAEQKDLDELEKLIDSVMNKDVNILTKYRTKLTTFVPNLFTKRSSRTHIIAVEESLEKRGHTNGDSRYDIINIEC
jgi:hypothetical protein